MTRCTFGDTNVFFNFPKFDRNRGSHWMHFCHTVFRMFSCLQINWQPFYLRQLLKFYPFDWLIEIYLQTEGQGTHHKMVSLQPIPGFSPLFVRTMMFSLKLSFCDFTFVLNLPFLLQQKLRENKLASLTPAYNSLAVFVY